MVLLDSPNEEVLEQALWLLGNLAGEGAAARDAVLAVDALPPLVRCLERHQVICCCCCYCCGCYADRPNVAGTSRS